jgi:hypothetical protein
MTVSIVKLLLRILRLRRSIAMSFALNWAFLWRSLNSVVMIISARTTCSLRFLESLSQFRKTLAVSIF